MMGRGGSLRIFQRALHCSEIALLLLLQITALAFSLWSVVTFLRNAL